jgi:signal transduction histidine kinase
MDYWLLGNKTALLIYVIAISYFYSAAALPWLVPAYLFYMIVNLAVPIFKSHRFRTFFAVLSIGLVLLFAVRLDPVFALLLPANVYEIILYSAIHTNPILRLPPMLLPGLFLPGEQVAAYLLAALLSFLLLTSAQQHAQRLVRLEEERDRLQGELHQLTRSLHEDRELHRQSAYVVQLEERSRLSQQIHDEVGHAMAGALIQMEASKRMMSADPAKAQYLLDNAIMISKQGLERIRMTLKGLKPRSEELGINRLRLLADETSAKHAIDATVTYTGDIDTITPLQWSIIHQNAVEAITNSLKYSEATAIRIEIGVLNRMIKCVVEDNGKGADKIKKGLGIVGMEERAASAGGTVLVDGSKGFRVTTLLPIRPDKK